MSLSSAKAKLDAQGGDPVTGYISKTDHQESYDELVDDTALTGATTAEAVTVSGALVAGTVNGRDPDDLVAGPASATDNALVRFDGTGGKTVQNSGITVDDSNNISGVGTFASGAVTSSGAVQAAAASGFVVGSSGPRVMSGTGSPEGVVTAPVGSRWIRTDGDTLGDFEYQKRSGTGNTGWVVKDGDTGLRDLSAALSNTWTAAAFWVRRVGPTVFLTGVNVTGTSATDPIIYTLPAGFRPSNTSQLAAWYDTGATHSPGLTVSITGALSFGGTRAYYLNGRVTATWSTTDPWPTSLPG